jgi:glutamate synthase domain-containing protein 1
MITKSFTQMPRMRDHAACGIAGMFNLDRKLVSGEPIAKMMATMEERENGLGAGYAAYGLFPKMKEYYCLQMILDDQDAKAKVEEFLNTYTSIVSEEEVPVKKGVLKEYPFVRRFFIEPKLENGESADDAVKDIMMYINCSIKGAFCMSSGKDMAVFKGVGWATEIADFYQIKDIKAFMWSAHSRFPTNTPGWWGGAHPFSLLGHAVVHNGEITSYGTNVSYLKEFGYECKMLTDTEVLAYIFDFIARKCNYPPKIAHRIATTALAPPYWKDIDRMSAGEKKWATNIRIAHRKAMANGPFSIIITTDMPKPTMIGHSDRKKLRPMIAALSEDGKTFYLSSELNSIHTVDKTMNYWQPDPGKPVIASLGEPIITGTNDPLGDLELR